jgi:hypothetical protein
LLEKFAKLHERIVKVSKDKDEYFHAYCKNTAEKRTSRLRHYPGSSVFDSLQEVVYLVSSFLKLLFFLTTVLVSRFDQESKRDKKGNSVFRPHQSDEQAEAAPQL